MSPHRPGIRGRLSYANVMATIAVFIALGGGAYAVSNHAPADSVDSKAIINGQVKSADVKDNSLTAADLGTDSVNRDEIGFHEVVVGNIADGAISSAKLGTVFPVTNTIHVQGGAPGIYGQNANCPEGSRLISGGADALGDAVLVSSTYGTLSGPGSWEASVRSYSGDSGGGVTIIAICLGS